MATRTCLRKRRHLTATRREHDPRRRVANNLLGPVRAYAPQSNITPRAFAHQTPGYDSPDSSQHRTTTTHGNAHHPNITPRAYTATRQSHTNHMATTRPTPRTSFNDDSRVRIPHNMATRQRAPPRRHTTEARDASMTNTATTRQTPRSIVRQRLGDTHTENGYAPFRHGLQRRRSSPFFVAFHAKERVERHALRFLQSQRRHPKGNGSTLALTAQARDARAQHAAHDTEPKTLARTHTMNMATQMHKTHSRQQP